MILRNQAECPTCHDFIASIDCHDFRVCKCGSTAVDGGTDYLRRMGHPIDKSIVIPVEIPKQDASYYLGIIFAMDVLALNHGCYHSVEEIGDQMSEQHNTLPWFPVPESAYELSQKLKDLMGWDLVGYVSEKGGWILRTSLAHVGGLYRHIYEEAK